MYVHVCIYIYIYMYTCMHAYIHTYIHTYIYIYIHTYIHIHIHIYIYICIHKRRPSAAVLRGFPPCPTCRVLEGFRVGSVHGVFFGDKRRYVSWVDVLLRISYIGIVFDETIHYL